MSPNQVEQSEVRRAYSYVRFSSKRQQKGESQRRQVEFAVEVCKENGWFLDEGLTLHDLGVSAFRGNNVKVGALGEFLEAIRIGRVSPGSVLIVESIDRLSRNKVGQALQLFISVLNSGVSILTREPRRHYTQDSINDIASLLEPLIYMSRAHEESATKSFRLRDVWKKKIERAGEKGLPMTRLCPRWMELTESGYKLIPERAMAVRDIFRMCRQGLGTHRIMHELVKDPLKYPPFGQSGKWSDGYVLQILQNRATFGEFQPRMRNEQGGRSAFGAVLKDYYPAVVAEEEFYEVQATMKGRFRQVGRPGEYETNLFTGMVYCKTDGAKMSVFTHRQRTRPGAEPQTYHYLTSGSVKNGSSMNGSGLSFPYPAFEEAILESLSELRAVDLEDHQGDVRKQEKAELAGQLVTLDRRIEENEQRAADPDEECPETYINVAKSARRQRKEKGRRLEELKAESAKADSVDLDQVKSLIDLMRETEGEELKEVRRKLKARIRTMVASIGVYITTTNRLRKNAAVTIKLRTGREEKIVVDYVATQASDTAGTDATS